MILSYSFFFHVGLVKQNRVSKLYKLVLCDMDNLFVKA